MRISPQLNLDFSLEYVKESPPPPKPSLSIVKTEKEAAPEPAEKPYCGFINSATWGAWITLKNDFSTYQKFHVLFADGKLSTKEMELAFNALGEPLNEWMTGNVNWAEIAEDFGFTLAEEIASEEFPQTTLAVVSRCEIEGNIVRLPCKLDRPLYEQVNRILAAFGGKWNKKSKGHLFEEDPSDMIDAFILTGKVKKPEKYGYFPTPQPLARMVVALAGIEKGMKVFEPEAGQGGLADEIIDIVGGTQHIMCCELQENNVKVLREKGYTVIHQDFMTLEENFMGTMEYFDRIVMNPPFEKQQDLIHVSKAWEFLKPGGRLTSITSPGFTFRQDKRATEFREFVGRFGRYIENPEGSFKPSGTSINTLTVVLDKPN